MEEEIPNGSLVAVHALATASERWDDPFPSKSEIIDDGKSNPQALPTRGTKENKNKVKRFYVGFSLLAVQVLAMP